MSCVTLGERLVDMQFDSLFINCSPRANWQPERPDAGLKGRDVKAKGNALGREPPFAPRPSTTAGDNDSTVEAEIRDAFRFWVSRFFPWSVSLRTLLIVTTLVAVELGLAVWSVR